MKLTDKQVEQAIAYYGKGDGAGLSEIAEAMGVDAATIRYHLKKHGVYVPKAGAPPVEDKFETDEELGFGVEDEAPAPVDQMSALLADPRMAAMLDQLVAQRVAQMTVAASAPSESGAMAELAKTLGRMIELQAIQQPGYQKPLSAEEMESRLAGKVQMDSLMAHYRNIGLTPKYTVGDGGFFECTNAIEIAPGSEVRTFLPPPEDFIAENEPAIEIMAAQRKWLGVATAHIGDQVEAAMKAAKGPMFIDNVPTAAAKPGLVEITKQPPEKASKTRRSMGSIVREPVEITMAERAAGPQGPVFADAAA